MNWKELTGRFQPEVSTLICLPIRVDIQSNQHRLIDEGEDEDEDERSKMNNRR